MYILRYSIFFDYYKELLLNELYISLYSCIYTHIVGIVVRIVIFVILMCNILFLKGRQRSEYMYIYVPT